MRWWRGVRGATFVRWHRVGDYVYEIAHVCPGEGCAIAEWLESRDHRDDDRRSRDACNKTGRYDAIEKDP